jgi:hypothetical protein
MRFSMAVSGNEVADIFAPGLPRRHSFLRVADRTKS